MPRKHFEKIIQEIANMYGETRISIRNEIKDILVERWIIKSSTTELNDEELKKLANLLHGFWADQDQRPPDERSTLNLTNILKYFKHDESLSLQPESTKKNQPINDFGSDPFPTLDRDDY
jgi:hypothetical protein